MTCTHTNYRTHADRGRHNRENGANSAYFLCEWVQFDASRRILVPLHPVRHIQPREELGVVGVEEASLVFEIVGGVAPTSCRTTVTLFSC